MESFRLDQVQGTQGLDLGRTLQRHNQTENTHNLRTLQRLFERVDINRNQNILIFQ